MGKKPTIFISKRDEADNFLSFLRVPLSKRYEVLDQNCTAQHGLDAPAHSITTTGWATTCDGAVILLSKRLFDPSVPGETSAQLREVQALMARRNQPTGGQGPFPIISVLLQNTRSAPTIAEMQRKLTLKWPGLAPLLQMPVVVVPKGTAETKQDGWDAARDEIVDFLRDTAFVRNNPAPRRKTQVASTKASGAKRSSAARELPASEPGGSNSKPTGAVRTRSAAKPRVDPFDYLARSFSNWLCGQIAYGAPDDGAQFDGEGESPFEFDLRRFIPLSAQGPDPSGGGGNGSEGAPAETAATLETRSALDWVLHPTFPPMVLLGGLGSGKTAVLTTAAALMAARLDPVLRARCPAKPEVWKQYETPDRVDFFPIVLDANWISRLSGEGRRVDAAQIERAIACALVDDESLDGDAVDDVMESIAAHPLALLIDRFESISLRRGRVDVRNALHEFSTKRSRNGAPVRLVIAGRTIEPRSDLLPVTLQEVSKDQCDTFLVDYVGSTGGDTRSLERLRASTQRWRSESASQGHDILANPATLNIFCWSVKRAEGKPVQVSHRLELCARIVDRLTRTTFSAHGLDWTEKDVRRALELLSYELVFQGGAMPLVDLVESVRQLVDDRAARAGVTPPNIERDPEPALLEALRIHTGLFVREGDTDLVYSLRNSLVASYLAAHFIVSRQEERQYLDALDPKKSAQIAPFLSFLGWEILNRGGEYSFERALRAPLQMLMRAGTAFDEHESGAYCTDAGEWAMMAASTLREAPPARTDREAKQEPVEAVYRQAAEVYSRTSGLWLPSQRAQFLADLAASIHRPRSFDRATAVHDLLDTVTGAGGFVPVKCAFDTGDEVIHVAARPTLVAEFAAFIDDASAVRSPTAAGVAFTPIHKDAQVPVARGIKPGLEPPNEIWRQMRANVGLPVTYLTWWETIAYCQWLTEALRKLRPGSLGPEEVVRPATPTEYAAIAEALAGPDSHFPWGSDDNVSPVGAPCANLRSAGLARATTPGVFPPRRGVFDFSSNVATWTIPDAGPSDQIWPPSRTPDSAAVCGASFQSATAEAHKSRTPPKRAPETRSREIGLRLVRVLRIHGRQPSA